MPDHTQGRPEWMSQDVYSGESIPPSTGQREIPVSDTTEPDAYDVPIEVPSPSGEAKQ